MRKLALIFSALLFLFLAPIAKAEVIFEDSFDNYTDGAFPSKWQENIRVGSDVRCVGKWEVVGGQLKVSLQNQHGCSMQIIPSFMQWSEPLESYVYEVDVKFVGGIDRHITYRYAPSVLWFLVLHFQSPGDFTVTTNAGNYLVNVPRNYIYNEWYRFKMIVTNNDLKVFVSNLDGSNSQLVREVVHTNPIPNGLIGLGASPGIIQSYETWFDNVKVTTIGHVEEEDGNLQVPLLKQTDPAWADDIYDSAGLWTTESPTIARWGCAITSAAMVLNYHKVNKLPDGTQLDPGSLNAYLKSIPDGYVRNGLTNWQAIAVMAKSAKPQNPEFVHDSFEYEWGNDDVSALQADIDAGVPSILEVGMPGGGSHFVVATGVDEGAVAVNDPGFDRSDLTEYGNDFLSTRRFIPSNTDLSYMMFVVDPNVNILLKDEMGNVVGSPILEKPIEDPLGLLTNSMGPLKVVHFGKPSTGNYKIEISSSSTQSYHLDGYLYDELGGLKMMVSKGLVGENSADRLNIHFDKSDINLSFVDNSQNSVPSLIEDLEHLKELGHFKNNGSYNSIKSILKNVERMNGKNSAKLLSNLKQQLADGGKDGVDEFARQYLIAKIDLILSS